MTSLRWLSPLGGRVIDCAAAGDYKQALEHAEKALAQAPDPLNKNSLEDAVAKLKAGRDMNITP